MSSWILVGFIPTEPQRELPPPLHFQNVFKRCEKVVVTSCNWTTTHLATWAVLNPPATPTPSTEQSQGGGGGGTWGLPTLLASGSLRGRLGRGPGAAGLGLIPVLETSFLSPSQQRRSGSVLDGAEDREGRGGHPSSRPPRPRACCLRSRGCAIAPQPTPHTQAHRLFVYLLKTNICALCTGPAPGRSGRGPSWAGGQP